MNGLPRLPAPGRRTPRICVRSVSVPRGPPRGGSSPPSRSTSALSSPMLWRSSRPATRPSPDVMCNRMIKFGAFVDACRRPFRSGRLGHHARVRGRDGAFTSCEAHQGPRPYFSVPASLQEQLAQCPFLSVISPRRCVRPRPNRFASQRRPPDSQGICFLGRVSRSTISSTTTSRPTRRDPARPPPARRWDGTWFHGLGLGSGP